MLLAMLTPINTGSVTHQVINRIKQALIDGELLPGDKLPTESELCASWQVSRTPVREAIKVLEYMGLLEIRRSEGTYVCERIKPSIVNPLVFRLLFMAESAEQLIEFRYQMESMIMRMAMERLTPAAVTELEHNLACMDAAMQGQASPDELLALDLQFHDLIAQASGNALVRELAREIYTVFSQSMRQSHTGSAADDSAIKHHRGLLKALVEKDVVQGEAILRESLKAWRSFIERTH